MPTFHMTALEYDSRKRWWLFRTPRHQADSTSNPAPGKRIRTTRDRQLTLCAGEPWRDRVDEQRRRRDANQHDHRHDQREQRRDRARDAIRLAPFAAREQRRVHRDEGSGERLIAEQVLQEVRDAERGAPGVRFHLEAEVVRDDALAHQPREPAAQDADRDEERGAPSRGRPLARRLGRGVSRLRRQSAHPASRWRAASDRT